MGYTFSKSFVHEDSITSCNSNLKGLTVNSINAYLSPKYNFSDNEILSYYSDNNKNFSERFKVFYNKDTYVLVDTEKGLLAKVKKSKDATDDIEVAVLYLILKGFCKLKTSKINKLISAIDKPIKYCLYELADRYDVVMYVNNGYSCKAIPKSTKRMVKCLIDNVKCNRKDAS